MQKISQKSAGRLYSEVHSKVMDSRIQIQKLMKHNPILSRAVDDILFELSVQAPKAALSCFKNPSETK